MQNKKMNQLIDNFEKFEGLLSSNKEQLDKSVSNYFVKHKERYLHQIKIFTQFFKGGKILEIGANPYHLTTMLKDAGYTIVGIDMEPDKKNFFIKKYDLKIFKCNIETEKLPFDSNEFDFIFFTEVFEHLRINPLFALKEIHRVMKPNGILLFSTPNLYSLGKVISYLRGNSFNDAIDVIETLYFKGYCTHFREYSSKELKGLLVRNGFNVIDIVFRNYDERPGTTNKIFYSINRLFPKTLQTINVICKK